MIQGDLSERYPRPQKTRPEGVLYAFWRIANDSGAICRVVFGKVRLSSVANRRPRCDVLYYETSQVLLSSRT
jgi:hypothetical protein